MSVIDDILKKYNLKYDDLQPEERATLNEWAQSLSQGSLTIEKIRKYLANMRDSIEQELTNCELREKQDIFLKARLKNYMLLEAFLSTPERAREALEKAVGSLVVLK